MKTEEKFMGFTDAKSIFTSVTFWGAIVSLVATVVPSAFSIVGLGASASDQSVVVAHIVQIVGFGITVYGRLAATKATYIVPPPLPPKA
jgi:hypothetical protein